MNSTLTLTQEWDKMFPQNAAVDHCKVTFHNRFGIELAADLYKPKNAAGKRAAVAVSGPFGAVKEQSSGLYAQELAARAPAREQRNRRPLLPVGVQLLHEQRVLPLEVRDLPRLDVADRRQAQVAQAHLHVPEHGAAPLL